MPTLATVILLPRSLRFPFIFWGLFFYICLMPKQHHASILTILLASALVLGITALILAVFYL
jgi:hypothetical protein